MDLGTAVSIAGLGLTVLGITVAASKQSQKLESRIDNHDTLFGEREKLELVRQEDVKNRLVRIEQKLDQMNTSR